MKTMALSREVTLTIDNYNITLDKEIKIYEYDAINLCFTIQEYGIVMRDGKAHNRVMPVVALKAYMLIETPQGVDSVEATNIVRNKIIFSLGNKYSQFVGVGKMQIILKDLDGCRITLPEFTYEVKQSINTDWETPDVLIDEKDFVVTDELGRPVDTTKISEMDEVNEITPQTYTMVINEDGNKKIKLNAIIDEMIEVYDDEEVEVEFPSLHNDVERIKGEMNEISESLDNITQDTNIIVKVGEGGEYTNINDAIAFLSRKKLKYDKSGFKAEILLKSGFIIEEQIYAENINLGYITISSEDEIVLANCSKFRQNIYEEPYGNEGYPVNSASLLTGYGNAVLPNINILVDLQNTNSSSASSQGVFLIYGASARICRGKGFINSGGSGVGVYEGSKLYATDTIIKNSFGNNISCFRGSYVLFRGGCATGSKNGYGVYLDNLSSIDCVSADFSDNAESGIWAGGYSMVSANRTVINNCGRAGVTADESSIVDVHNSTICNNAQSGIDCNSAKVSCGNSIITGNTTAITVSNGGIVDGKSSNLTGSKGNNSVYANYGGIANVSKATVQKIEGVNDKDLRVGYGGIIFAHGVTDSGYSGATPNVLSNNGIIFNGDEIPIDYGETGQLKFKVVFGKYNSGVSSTSFPVSYLNKKNVSIRSVSTYNGSSLSADEISLIAIEKYTNNVSFTVNDETLANKLAETCSTFVLNVTLI